MLYQQGAHNGSNMGHRMHSYPIYQDFQQKAAPFAEVLCRRLVETSISVENQTERVDTEMVSGNYFSMLGVKPPPAASSTQRKTTRSICGHPVVVLSYDYWARALCRRPQRGRQEDPGEQLSDDHRRRVRQRLRWSRSRALAADSRAGPHEDR